MALHARAARYTCFDYTVRDIFFTELVCNTATEKKVICGARADSRLVNFTTALVRNTATEEKVAYCACASLCEV